MGNNSKFLSTIRIQTTINNIRYNLFRTKIATYIPILVSSISKIFNISNLINMISQSKNAPTVFNLSQTLANASIRDNMTLKDNQSNSILHAFTTSNLKGSRVNYLATSQWLRICTNKKFHKVINYQSFNLNKWH